MMSVTYTLVERVLSNLATSKLIAVSEEERELMLELKLAPDEQIALINNGVEDWSLAYFSESKVDQAAPYEKPLTFGSIMRFSAQKAPGHLVKAFVRLVQMLPQEPIRLTVAGDGEHQGTSHEAGDRQTGETHPDWTHPGGTPP